MINNFEQPQTEEQPEPEKKARDWADIISEENEIANRLEKERGIFYREKIDPETGEKKCFVNILGVELETSATKEEIESIKSDLIFSKTDQKIMKEMAECHKLEQALMLEGAPGIGKTFLVEKFAQLLHGEDETIASINGSPKTSELEILGHWTPKGLSEEETQRYNNELKGLMEEKEVIELKAWLDQELSKANDELSKGIINDEEYNEKFGELSTKYIEDTRKFLQKTRLADFVNPSSDWEFQNGALMEAYIGNNGRGRILFVDEFNLIPSNYQQIFLQIGGKRGGLSNSMTFWGNGKQTRYKRGENTRIIFANNYPETTEGRNVVSAPMTDRVVWYAIPDEDALEKERMAILSDGGNIKRVKTEIKIDPKEMRLPAIEPIPWREALNEELAVQITNAGLELHEGFKNNYSQVGDSININNKNRKRVQKLETSPRNFYRFSDYITKFQIRNNETGFIDFTETLRNAFRIHYINRLADSESREKMEALFDEIMIGTTGQVMFEKETKTRKEVFDILSERASLTEEEKNKRKKEEQERALREAEAAKNKAMDLQKKMEERRKKKTNN